MAIMSIAAQGFYCVNDIQGFHEHYSPGLLLCTSLLDSSSSGVVVLLWRVLCMVLGFGGTIFTPREP